MPDTINIIAAIIGAILYHFLGARLGIPSPAPARPPIPTVPSPAGAGQLAVLEKVLENLLLGRLQVSPPTSPNGQPFQDPTSGAGGTFHVPVQVTLGSNVPSARTEPRGNTS